MKKILLVEDEADMTLIVADTLEEQGYTVITAHDGEEGLAKFLIENPDIIIADVMMPKLDGFSMARKIRDISQQVPLLFLTAKSTVDDIEQGFDIGANDYLRKPFELRELIVRIRSLLRRGSPSMQDDKIYTIGGYRFNATTQTLQTGPRSAELSNIEAKLLEPLAANMGKTVSASELMTAVWGRDEQSNRNSLHGFIHKLRKALSADPSISIINQRGFGYMLICR